MTILDGKALSQKILAELKEKRGEMPQEISLAVVAVGQDEVIEAFITQKKKAAAFLGVDFRVHRYPLDISTNELRKRIATIVHDANPDGVIVQLPLPAHINTQYILNSIPPGKDVDVLSARAVGDFAVGKSRIFPPVVGALKSLFKEYAINHRNLYHVVVGAGALVGKPISWWLLNEKISFTLLDQETQDVSFFTKNADILISGIGKPGYIIGDMLKDGVIAVDAGTSESNGEIRGDINFPSASVKASFITPVPGGIGPMSVAMVYKNLFELAQRP